MNTERKPAMTTSAQTASTRSKQKTSTNATDAVALLKADHRAVEELFEKFENSRRADQKAKIAQDICNELTVHATIEEKDFYPAAQEALEDDKDLVDEARVEHASLKWLIAQIEQEAPESELFDAKVKVLKEYVAHHVKEEEKEMFPKLKKTELDLKALGARLAASKEQLKQEAPRRH
jgi:hemerythrin superfamily protein